MPPYKMIELFAGIGGIRLGFERAFGNEVETVFVSEIDKYAVQTYRKNFDTPAKIFGDIRDIDEKNIPAFDICLAGFPCQAFSIAGKKQGFNDDYYGEYRGTLFREVVRVCDFHKPKIIFCENVKGLVIHDKGRTFKTICDAFEKRGYKLHYKILNSKNFGLAQNRERIYIVCFRNDIDDSNFKFPEPTNKKVTLAEILEEAPILAKYYLSETYVKIRRRKLWIKNYGRARKKLLFSTCIAKFRFKVLQRIILKLYELRKLSGVRQVPSI